MGIGTKESVGALALTLAGGIFGRETLIWAWNKALDGLARLFGDKAASMTLPEPIPWVDFAGLALMLVGLGLLGSSLRSGLWFKASVPEPQIAPLVEAKVMAPIVNQSNVYDDPQAKSDLAVFVIEYLLPACEVQRVLRNAIMRKLCHRMSGIEKLARKGLDVTNPIPGFHESRKLLVNGTAHGVVSISLEEMARAVAKLSRLYPVYCDKSGWMSREPGLNFKTDPDTAEAFADWQQKNQWLEAAYKPFLRDVRFPELNNLLPRQQGKAFVIDL